MLKNLFKSKQTKLLEQIVKTLEKRDNSDVRVDLSGYKKPQKVVRVSDGTEYFPDVTSFKGGQFRIFTVISEKFSNSDEIIEKWKLFETFASQNDSQFYIVFPTGMVMDIKKILEENNIRVNLWELKSEKHIQG